MSQAITDFQGISANTWSALVDAAKQIRQHAHAPYSKFAVGASLLTDDDQIVSGCNMENATFGATTCAERNAFATAIGQGYRRFKALCVLTDVDTPSAPCGICRQVISEFCPDIPILMINPQGAFHFSTLNDLLPLRFSGSDF